MESYATMFGMQHYTHKKDVSTFDESTNLSFMGKEITILSLPGHSPGHIAFYFKDHKICFSGDVIFKNSIGRTDLPGGDSVSYTHLRAHET